MKRLLRIVIFTLLLISMSALAFNIESVEAAPEMIYVDDSNITGPWNGTKEYPYQNITNALEQASDIDTIYVCSGTYYEHVLVNKSISIIGENKTTTILDGGGQKYTIINVIKPYVTIAGFTIQNAADDNLAYGISISKTENVTIHNNIITTGHYGILLHLSSHCTISANNVSNSHYYGIGLWSTPSQGARNNTFIGNSIIDNRVGIYIADPDCQYNIFYNNNIVNNTDQLAYFGWPNSLDNGVEGNYWSDYNGTDLDNDGIGDTVVPHEGDNCPLMGMFSSFNTSVGKHVNVISNSTIESFQYFEFNSTIKMYVSNMMNGQTHGFCRICILYELMNVTSISVRIDDGETAVLYHNYNLYDNGTHRWIYFAYEHSTHEIDIIPEFPLIMIAPLFIAATTLAVMFLRKKRHGVCKSHLCQRIRRNTHFC
jgi:parallel beta-helix repeat protein